MFAGAMAMADATTWASVSASRAGVEQAAARAWTWATCRARATRLAMALTAADLATCLPRECHSAGVADEWAYC
jgi:hypothetical protein